MSNGAAILSFVRYSSSIHCFHHTSATRQVIGAVVGAAAGATLIPFMAPAAGTVAASKFPPQADSEVVSNPSNLLGTIVAGAKAVGYVVIVSATVVAKSKALSAAVGAGLGAVTVAYVRSDSEVRDSEKCHRHRIGSDE